MCVCWSLYSDVPFIDLHCVRDCKDAHHACLLNAWISHVVPRSKHVPVGACGLGVGRGVGMNHSFPSSLMSACQHSWAGKVSVVICFWHSPHDSSPLPKAREEQEKHAPHKGINLMHRPQEAAEVLVDYQLLQLLQNYWESEYMNMGKCQSSQSTWE